MGRGVDCCNSYLSGNTDGSYTCNECGNQWLPFCVNLGSANKKRRLRSLVRLALLENQGDSLTSTQIMEYIKGMGHRNVPTTHQISNFCIIDPHIVRNRAVRNSSGNIYEWKIVHEPQIEELQIHMDVE